MPILRNVILASLVAGLGLSSHAMAQAAGGGRGGGGAGGGEGPFAAVPGALDRRIDNGCYRAGDTVSIDWQGLAEFDGAIRVVADGAYAPLPVTSWNGRAVMVRVEGVPAGETYPVVWTTAGDVQAEIGALRTCAVE